MEFDPTDRTRIPWSIPHSCRSITQVPAPEAAFGVPFNTPANIGRAVVVVHRPGKGGCFPSGNNTRAQACTFHAKLLMEASGQQAIPWFLEHGAAEVGSFPNPDTRQAAQSGPSVTARGRESAPLVWIHLYLFCCQPHRPTCLCPPHQKIPFPRPSHQPVFFSLDLGTPKAHRHLEYHSAIQDPTKEASLMEENI